MFSVGAGDRNRRVFHCPGHSLAGGGVEAAGLDIGLG